MMQSGSCEWLDAYQGLAVGSDVAGAAVPVFLSVFAFVAGSLRCGITVSARKNADPKLRRMIPRTAPVPDVLVPVTCGSSLKSKCGESWLGIISPCGCLFYRFIANML